MTDRYRELRKALESAGVDITTSGHRGIAKAKGRSMSRSDAARYAAQQRWGANAQSAFETQQRSMTGRSSSPPELQVKSSEVQKFPDGEVVTITTSSPGSLKPGDMAPKGMKPGTAVLDRRRKSSIGADLNAMMVGDDGRLRETRFKDSFVLNDGEVVVVSRRRGWVYYNEVARNRDKNQWWFNSPTAPRTVVIESLGNR